MALSIEVLPRIPSRVMGADGITVAKSNGSMVVGFDYAASGFGAELKQAVDTANASASSATESASSAAISAADAAASAGSLTIASEPQALEGTINNRGMSPLRVQQSKLGVQTADSLTNAQSVNISTTTKVLMAHGKANAGDIVPAPFVSRLSSPNHAGKTLINGVWYELERRDGVYIEDFGAVNALQSDGSIATGIDNYTAIMDAIDYCIKKRRALLRITSGVWPCTQGNILLPVGINIRGHGHSSSMSQGGSVLLADYNEPSITNVFVQYTGSGQQYNSTGGGIHRLTIQKGLNKTGGVLLKITGVSDDYRPGYMSFRDMKLSGTNGSADCDYCLIVDGSNLTTPNANGIRDLLFDNVWIDGWVSEGAQFINATHAKLQAFTASPTGENVNAIRITGNDSLATSKTTSLSATGLEAYGTIILDNCDQINISGRCTDLTITGNCTRSLIAMVIENGPAFAGTIGGVATTRDLLRTTNKTVILDGADDTLYVNSTKVVGARVTGFTAPTGTPFQGGWDPSTIGDLALRQRLKAIEDALWSHGLIGA